MTDKKQKPPNLVLLEQIEKDHTLPYIDKLELARYIAGRQHERWNQLRRCHKLTHLNILIRHFLMGEIIRLMRSQKLRLQVLQKQIEN